MIRNYFMIAWRGIKNNKLFSFINIFGLAVGLTCCLLITLYIYHEHSYDAHHKLKDRIYQLETLSTIEGKEDRYSTTPAPMAPVMQQEFPEVESYTRLMRLFQDDKTLFQYNSGKDVKSFYETNGYLADSTFFRMFSYRFKEGNPNTALDEPNSIVISEDIASKIFGNEPALNKVIHVNSATNGSLDHKVTGVFIPSRSPSHIDMRFAISIQTGEFGEFIRGVTNMVNNNMFYSYLLLKPGADPVALSKKFPAFIDRHAGVDLKASGRSKRQELTALADIHLYANTKGNVTPGGSVMYLRILIAIAIVTLLIACVNFMNLATAQSSKRAVEIGVRKVIGAERGSLIRQFLSEAILYSVIAFILSILLTSLLMPVFKNVADKDLSFSSGQYAIILLGFFIVTLLTGLIAGLYPAFYLSAFIPIKVLKGKFSNSLTAISFRKVLVVFQFVISAALIISSITIGNQMRYMRNKDLGFTKDQQIVIPLRSSNSVDAYPALKSELIANSAVSNAGASNYYPGIQNYMDWLMYKQGTSADQTRQVYINRVDNSFLQTLQIKVVAGRLFSKEFPADTLNSVILNEEAVKDFGFASAEDAVGKSIAATRDNAEVLFPIVGVVKNFHFEGLQNNIKSFGFLLNRGTYFNYMIAHVEGGKLKEALSHISASWKKLNPNEPFEYSFIDQDFQKNYASDERLASIISYFTIIAIMISCLGLFGLSTFTVEQRTKEIGIRKVLGADVSTIVGMLSRDFLILVSLAVVIATPLGWYAMNRWLENFAYRTDITWVIFAITILIVVVIAFATISFQSIKAALANPVKNLRTE
jgi:putative ABC transport system permease protein